jgi:hypothetical protein
MVPQALWTAQADRERGVKLLEVPLLLAVQWPLMLIDVVGSTSVRIIDFLMLVAGDGITKRNGAKWG